MNIHNLSSYFNARRLKVNFGDATHNPEEQRFPRFFSRFMVWCIPRDCVCRFIIFPLIKRRLTCGLSQPFGSQPHSPLAEGEMGKPHGMLCMKESNAIVNRIRLEKKSVGD